MCTLNFKVPSVTEEDFGEGPELETSRFNYERNRFNYETVGGARGLEIQPVRALKGKRR